jgi:hemerythrin superfamily protein
MNAVKPDQHPDALDLLTEQHDLIDQLIAQLTDDHISDERKALLFRTLADTIAAHAAAEETVFYPAVRAKETDEIVRESLQDHIAIKRELADLVMSELDDPRFAARLQILAAQLEHHARDQEEGVLFPRVRQLMDDEELAQLAVEIRAVFEQLLTEQPALDVTRQARAAVVHPA